MRVTHEHDPVDHPRGAQRGEDVLSQRPVTQWDQGLGGRPDLTRQAVAWATAGEHYRDQGSVLTHAPILSRHSLAAARAPAAQEEAHRCENAVGCLLVGGLRPSGGPQKRDWRTFRVTVLPALTLKLVTYVT